MPIENLFKHVHLGLLEQTGKVMGGHVSWQGIIAIRWHHRVLINTCHCTPSQRSIKCTAKIYHELNNYLRATSRLKL